MEYQELTSKLEELKNITYNLNREYEENGGEVTENTEQLEQAKEAIATLLQGEGIDLLGRWLKSVEDRKKATKAEKDYIARREKADERSIEYIKHLVTDVLRATGQEKVKGNLGYSFTAYDAVKTEVKKDLLKELYAERIREACKDFLPADVTITLGATISALPEGVETPEYYDVVVTPSARFTKPRANKNEE